MTDDRPVAPDDTALDVLQARFPAEVAAARALARSQAEALAAMPLDPADAP